MSGKRQKNQLQRVLAFTGERRSEAPTARREGTESLTAKRAGESPALPEQVMEEVCRRKNCPRALKQVKANKGSPGIEEHDGRRTPGLPEAALAGDPGTVAEGNLSSATGEASRDCETGRWSAQAGHSHGARQVCPAGGDAGSARQMGPNVLRTQSPISPAALSASGGGQGAAVYRRRPSLGRGYRSGKVLRSSQPRPADGSDSAAGERQEDAQADSSLPGIGRDGERAGKSGGGRNSARRASVSTAVEPRARRTRPRVGATRAPLRGLRG